MIKRKMIIFSLMLLVLGGFGIYCLVHESSIKSVLAATNAWITGSNKIYYTAGNVGIGTSNPSSRLHIGSTGAMNLKLEADTDNVGESDQPVISLYQDGGGVSAQLGFYNSTNNLRLINNYSGANIVLRSNGDICIGNCD